jgi:hypothetical protein
MNEVLKQIFEKPWIKGEIRQAEFKVKTSIQSCLDMSVINETFTWMLNNAMQNDYDYGFKDE